MAIDISSTTRRIVYTGSAGTGPYAFNFEVLAQTDIAAYFNDTELTLTTDFTVSIDPDGTGSVTIVVGTNVPTTPDADDRITIVGARTIERTTDFTTGGPLFATSLNDEFDSLTIFTQQNKEEADRAIKAPVTDPSSIDMTLPKDDDRKGKYLSFNATTGNPEVVNTVTDVTTIAGIASDVTTVSGIASNVTTVAGNSANVTTVANNISSVNTVATNIADVIKVAEDLNEAISEVETVANDLNEATSEIETVAASISNVDTVGTNISNVNTVAGISANVTTVAGISANVTTVAGVSSDVATLAPISANITTVAGVASDVTTVATNVADITNFSDVYLGPKTSDPATRNDASALQQGDLYFNTVSNEVKVYDGSAWTVSFVGGAGYLLSSNNLSELTSTSTARTNLGLGTIATSDTTDFVAKTSATGSAELPSGTTAERDGSPSAGYIRFNSDDGSFEGYNGSSWTSVGGGATGGGADQVFVENDLAVTTNYTISSGRSASSVGPITINSGITVTVPSGSRWVVL